MISRLTTSSETPGRQVWKHLSDYLKKKVKYYLFSQLNLSQIKIYLVSSLAQQELPGKLSIPPPPLVFSVDLVFEEELNLLPEISDF